MVMSASIALDNGDKLTIEHAWPGPVPLFFALRSQCKCSVGTSVPLPNANDLRQ